MELDERDLLKGKKFIVGKWRVDYIVNGFSDDLAHIPAAEFKSDDGSDFTALTFDFFEDGTVTLTDTSKGSEFKGTWNQTDMFEYRYELGDFIDLPEGSFRDAAEKLQVSEGTHLVFAIGFLAIALKKESDGVVTEPADVGEAEGGEGDEIVGTYSVVKALAFVNGDFDLFTEAEVKADLEAKKAAGEDVDDSALNSFTLKVEFTPDHTVDQWMKIPAGVSDEMIKEAVESGEILAARDGFFCAQRTEWKCVDGKYYYDTKQHREVFGEVQSSWDELVCEDGLIKFGGGSMMIRKD